jgi:tetratricopeptide (TPR) repeat protein
LGKRLKADYLVIGSYRIGDASGEPPLDVDIKLENAATGDTVNVLSDHVALSALNSLVGQTSSTLRSKVGLTAIGNYELDALANVLPPTTSVAQRVGFALDAMQRFDAARARDELLEAVAEAPTYAPAQLYLSRAWAALGYRQKSLAAAQQAATHAAGLPPELRLQIDAAVQTQSYDSVSSVKTWAKLAALKPLVLEYRLELGDAQIAVNDLAGAQATLAQSRALPRAAGDPRLDLLAARIAGARNDPKAAAAFAQVALAEAQRRGARGIIADARASLAASKSYLGDLTQADTLLTDAIADYRVIGNPRGEVVARGALAVVLSDQLQPDAARGEYQRAIALAQSIGYLAGMGSIYQNVCAMLWDAGDRDGAAAAARRSLQIAREIGDVPMQIWTRQALANIALDDAAPDSVADEFSEIAVLDESTNRPGAGAWSRATYADVLRLRGELSAAQENCLRAQRASASVSDPQFVIYTSFTCAVLAIDHGDIDQASRLLDRVRELSDASANGIYSANSRFEQGQIALEASQFATARKLLEDAARLFAAKEARTGEANAEALLALCAQEQGDTTERDRASARARQLRTAITSKQEIYVVDIALAQLPTDARARNDALDGLRKTAIDAERRHWVSWALEAQLAEWRVLKAGGDEAAASRVGAELRSKAERYGFRRIVALVNAPIHATR